MIWSVDEKPPACPLVDAIGVRYSLARSRRTPASDLDWRNGRACGRQYLRSAICATRSKGPRGPAVGEWLRANRNGGLLSRLSIEKGLHHRWRLLYCFS